MTSKLQPRPLPPAQIVSRLRSLVGAEYPYVLSTGSYHAPPAPDVPWTEGVLDPTKPASALGNTALSSDCAGAGTWGAKVERHRPGYNKGPNRVVAECDVEDDINSNSAIGDSLDAQDLFVPVAAGELIQPGDVLVYPSIRLRGTDGKLMCDASGNPLTWIGHWTTCAENPKGVAVGEAYHDLVLVQCFGPNGRKPAIKLTDGSMLDQHDATWPKPEHRTRVLRWVA